LSISTRLVVVDALEGMRKIDQHRPPRTPRHQWTVEIRCTGCGNQTVSDDGIDGAFPLHPGAPSRLRRATADRHYIAQAAATIGLCWSRRQLNQAKNMMRRVAHVRDARPVSLAGSGLDVNCLRHNVQADRMSTSRRSPKPWRLEGEATEDHLLAIFRRCWIE